MHTMIILHLDAKVFSLLFYGYSQDVRDCFSLEFLRFIVSFKIALFFLLSCISLLIHHQSTSLISFFKFVMPLAIMAISSAYPNRKLWLIKELYRLAKRSFMKKLNRNGKEDFLGALLDLLVFCWCRQLMHGSLRGAV